VAEGHVDGDRGHLSVGRQGCVEIPGRVQVDELAVLDLGDPERGSSASVDALDPHHTLANPGPG
jgi:hypothetical protein